jgi:hypothetical protein
MSTPTSSKHVKSSHSDAVPPAAQAAAEADTPLSLGQLRKVRDEIKLHIHLAGMEAKDRFGSLEAELAELERAAHATGDGVRHLLHRLHTNFQQFRDSLKQSQH